MVLSGTPRTFVGAVTLRLQGPVCHHVADAVVAELEGLAGVRVADLDVGAGVLVVTAARPTDRADVVTALDRLGCEVRP
jgi:hypothetical protein